MTLDELEQELDAALIAERLARINWQHAELELTDAITKAERIRQRWCEATLTPEQARFREWRSKYEAATYGR